MTKQQIFDELRDIAHDLINEGAALINRKRATLAPARAGPPARPRRDRSPGRSGSVVPHDRDEAVPTTHGKEARAEVNGPATSIVDAPSFAAALLPCEPDVI